MCFLTIIVSTVDVHVCYLFSVCLPAIQEDLSVDQSMEMEWCFMLCHTYIWGLKKKSWYKSLFEIQKSQKSKYFLNGTRQGMFYDLGLNHYPLKYLFVRFFSAVSVYLWFL